MTVRPGCSLSVCRKKKQTVLPRAKQFFTKDVATLYFCLNPTIILIVINKEKHELTKQVNFKSRNY